MFTSLNQCDGSNLLEKNQWESCHGRGTCHFAPWEFGLILRAFSKSVFWSVVEYRGVRTVASQHGLSVWILHVMLVSARASLRVLLLPPTSQRLALAVKLIVLPVGLWMWDWGCLSPCHPCDGLATRPECTPSLAWCYLGLTRAHLRSFMDNVTALLWHLSFWGVFPVFPVSPPLLCRWVCGAGVWLTSPDIWAHLHTCFQTGH